MYFPFKPMELAMLIAMTQLTDVAYAQTQNTSAVIASPASATATKAPISTKVPEDWIMYDDTTYTPVVDDVSRHLAAARKAFDANDNTKAATEMRAVADALKLQATHASQESKLAVKADKTRLAADTKFALDDIKRMNASALKISAAAASIESGKIKTKAELDKVIDRAARADMERRWQVADVTTWYPVTEGPQLLFKDVIAANAKKDYKTAAADIRKATSYLRLEAGRAIGDVKQELDESIVELDKLARLTDSAAIKQESAHENGGTLSAAIKQDMTLDEQAMAKTFAKVEHALALAHHSKVAESWARKEYNDAGYELKAAASDLESAAVWTSAEATSDASAVVADTRALGDKIATGVTVAREDIGKGFESLGNGINALGQKIASTKKAQSFAPAKSKLEAPAPSPWASTPWVSSPW